MWLLPQFYITRSLEQKFLWFVQYQALQENLLYNDVIFGLNNPIPTIYYEDKYFICLT